VNASDSLTGKLSEYSLPSGEITMSSAAAMLSGGETAVLMYR
jgi:hypothetical protein